MKAGDALMGDGAQQGAAGHPTVTAHRADRCSDWCHWQNWRVLVLTRTFSYVCVGTVGFLLLLWVCLLYLPDPHFVSDENSPVTILIWTHPFGQYSKLLDCSTLYQIGGCTLTDDKQAYSQADAVIIHHREVATGAAKLPAEPRPRAQKWIWMNYESPTHTPELYRFEGVFNLTMTYRTDSDIFMPYAYLVPREHGPKTLSVAHTLRAPSRSRLLRPRLLAWVVSNWSESHARVAFYHQLSWYLEVDVFGRAGRPLPEDNGRSSVLRLIEQYQFYLALENSQHTDYITEKLWNAVLAGAVPVVLGPSRKNYERFLPPEAFIHVDDFPTVEGLARYLMILRRNTTQLKRHLEWRKNCSVHQPTHWGEHFCTTCGVVRKNRGRTDVVKDLSRWFHS